MNPEISISKPTITPEEIEAVSRVLESNYIAEGPEVLELETRFAEYCGAEHAVAFNSGTAAIHTALYAAGIGKGDTVITTPFTFIASTNPILMQNAKVKFVDIEPDSFTLDTTQLESAYDPSVKAVLPVDLYGQPADYDAIWDFAEKHKLLIIEDACQAIGAAYQGKMAGTLGHAACFSLYATKNITSGEGGIMTTDSQDMAEAARQFRQHGMSAPYEYNGIGYNYRSNDILAAMATAQLAKVDVLNQARFVNAQKLTDGLKGIDNIVIPEVKPNRTSSWHQYTVRVSENFPLSRDDLKDELKKRGIGTAIYYPKPLHLYPHIQELGYSAGDFPEAERAAREVLSIPVHPGLSDEDINRIIQSFREIAHA